MGAYSASVLEDGPCLYWKLDDEAGTEAKDESGKGFTGTYVNTPTLAVATALPNGEGKSVSFARASSEQVTKTDNAEFRGMTSMSCDCWLKPATAPESGQFYTIAFKGPTAGHWAWGFDYRNAAGTKKVVVYIDDNVTSGESAFTPTLSLTEWTYVAWTWDGTNVRLYINGAPHASNPVADGTGATMNNAETNAVYLASFHEVDYFNGGIDEFAIYRNKVLTQARIEAHYAAGQVVLQKLLPDADNEATGWTSTPLWEKLKDASDATSVKATLA